MVEIALAEVGVREEGRNSGPRVRQYQAATWLEPGPWPWCAAFTCWVLKEWLKRHPSPPVKNWETWRCKDASAFGWEKWARARGLAVLPETEKAKAGDFVIFDFSHIGIVVKDQINDLIYTVEGNTNGRGEREGDGVWTKIRDHRLAKCYIRLTF